MAAPQARPPDPQAFSVELRRGEPRRGGGRGQRPRRRRRPASWAHRDPPLRGPSLRGPAAQRPPHDRLRRPRPRRVIAGARRAPYGYEHLARDLEAVLAARVGEGRVVLAGHSMGAHTAAAHALRNPDRVAGAVFVGPAVAGMPTGPESLAYWDRLADGLERGRGGRVPPGLRPRPRPGLAGDDPALHPGADRGPPPPARPWPRRSGRWRARCRSRACPSCSSSTCRQLVVASHDDADPGHPRAIAEAWAESLPRARLIGEEPGQSPLAWQGGRLSRAIADFCATDEVRERLA